MYYQRRMLEMYFQNVEQGCRKSHFVVLFITVHLGFTSKNEACKTKSIMKDNVCGLYNVTQKSSYLWGVYNHHTSELLLSFFVR